MCTAATFQTKDTYFGRTLDYEFSYGEEVVITPRRYQLKFREMGIMEKHYAMIGTAHVANGYPLYYEAVNEKGLGMAGLNFVENAKYFDKAPGKDNVAQFEFIPWIVSQCATVAEARKLIAEINLINEPFSGEIPIAELHWMLADKDEAITVESTKHGMQVFDNPVGVLTNNPPFEEQMFQLNNYMALSPGNPVNNFSKKLHLYPYSRGMGALGLPGDLSSPSRFVRAAFVRMNSVCGDTEEESVSQFFHILGSVDQQRGCCCLGEGEYEVTIYTCCTNLQKGIHYYTTYGNQQITAVDMNREPLDGAVLIRYPFVEGQQIKRQN